MRSLIQLLAFVSALLLSAYTSASQVFDYRYTFHTGDVVAGSFIGNASGNLITYFSDITVIINGSPLNSTGTLYGASLVASGVGNLCNCDWVDGGAVMSFDGLQNNFGFSDAHNPGAPNWTNVFASYTGATAHDFKDQIEIYRSDPFLHSYDSLNGGGAPYDPSRWSVTAAAVPSPASAWLLGSGLLGLAGAARKRKNISEKPRSTDEFG